jgi:hypothetical protein
MKTHFETLVSRRKTILVLAGVKEDEAEFIAAQQAWANIKDRKEREGISVREDAA